MNTTLTKWATVFGLIAAIITIAGFTTGIFSIQDLVERSDHPIRVDKKSSPSSTPKISQSFSERVKRFGRLFLFIFKILLIFFVPLLPSIGFWKIAENLDWEIEFDPVPQILVILLYLVSAVLCIALVFPTFIISQWVWHLIE